MHIADAVAMVIETAVVAWDGDPFMQRWNICLPERRQPRCTAHRELLTWLGGFESDPAGHWISLRWVTVGAYGFQWVGNA